MSKYWINLGKDSYVGHGLVEVDTVVNNRYMVSLIVKNIIEEDG